MSKTKKEVVRLREKKLANGVRSLYLDIYINGRRSYEFLKMYLVPEKTIQDKIRNQETMSIAETVKSQYTVKVYENTYGLKKTETKRINLIQYLESVEEQRRLMGMDGMAELILSLISRLKLYKGANVTLQEIDRKFMSGFVLHLKTVASPNTGKLLRPSTQMNYYVTLKACLNQAVKDGILVENPTLSVDPPRKEEIKKEVLTMDELKVLHNTPCSVKGLKESFLFCCFTGLRYSDMSSLTWENIGKSNNGGYQIAFRQKKTKSLAYIPLSQNAIEYMPERGNAKDTDLIFNVPSQSHINHLLKDWIREANINKKVTFHCARHSFATNLLSCNANIYVVQQLMGHANIQTTQIYAKISDSVKTQTVNLMPSIAV